MLWGRRTRGFHDLEPRDLGSDTIEAFFCTNEGKGGTATTRAEMVRNC